MAIKTKYRPLQTGQGQVRADVVLSCRAYLLGEKKVYAVYSDTLCDNEK
jgi:hypothetical protein